MSVLLDCRCLGGDLNAPDLNRTAAGVVDTVHVTCQSLFGLSMHDPDLGCVMSLLGEVG